MFKFYQVLHLLFTVAENSPAFEITGEIVSRKFTYNAGGKSYIFAVLSGSLGGVGLRFYTLAGFINKTGKVCVPCLIARCVICVAYLLAMLLFYCWGFKSIF